ncbi:threonine aldolase family protein [Pseudidiomarina sp.]|uniref:threonine aldolase family protein n=1 Tax=Pseudidiomarina sp. TaxID=2081707 RepID=UPI00299D024E|nr:beta-eliminating lyase-related protein [Pseudidiomarina sp.]MDX1706171.1 beta-eliminating lyase-related protein [Pseudidiomarina sp.]
MTDPIRQAYQEAARHAHSSILRHPPESMATTLRRLADRAEAADAPDYYGTGSLIEDFEARVAAMLGKPAALFLPSGTLAQPMALKIHAGNRTKQVIGMHPTSHMVLHEQNGYQHLWGLEGRLIGNKQQVLSHDDLRRQPPEELAAIVLELPMREIGGQLPAWDDLQAQVNWARQHNIAVHIDGARLWHCPAYYQRSLAEIGALADSVYVSLYKDIGGIAGAVLAGDAGFIDKARIWNRRAGGNLISLYPYILAAGQGFADNLASIDQAVEYTRRLGPLLANVADVRVNPELPQAAMFHLHINREPQVLVQAATGYAQQHGIVVLPIPRATEKGRSVCEISVGRRTMEHPPEFWQQHLRDCLATS